MEEKTDSEQPQTSAKMSAGDMAHSNMQLIKVHRNGYEIDKVGSCFHCP